MWKLSDVVAFIKSRSLKWADCWSPTLACGHEQLQHKLSNNPIFPQSQPNFRRHISNENNILPRVWREYTVNFSVIFSVGRIVVSEKIGLEGAQRVCVDIFPRKSCCIRWSNLHIMPLIIALNFHLSSFLGFLENCRNIFRQRKKETSCKAKVRLNSTASADEPTGHNVHGASNHSGSGLIRCPDVNEFHFSLWLLLYWQVMAWLIYNPHIRQ